MKFAKPTKEKNNLPLAKQNWFIYQQATIVMDNVIQDVYDVDYIVRDRNQFNFRKLRPNITDFTVGIMSTNIFIFSKYV